MSGRTHEIHACLRTCDDQQARDQKPCVPARSRHRRWKGEITDSLVAYHQARARGGVGLSTLEVCCVHPSTSSNRTLYGWDDRIVPGFKRISDAMHAHGMKLFVQLWHGGHHWPNIDGSPAWSASDIPSPWGHVPIAMSHGQINELVASFAATARRAREGGLDASSCTSATDIWCTNFSRRLQTGPKMNTAVASTTARDSAREILRAVRKEVGPDFAVGIRISDQHAPGGITADECADIVRAYGSDGLLDFVNASMGSYHDVPSMLPAMDTPTGAMLPSSGKIAAAASGKVVSMIAGSLPHDRRSRSGDPGAQRGYGRHRARHDRRLDLVVKTIAGQVDRVRPCIGATRAASAESFPPNRESIARSTRP